jgi:hypothetical protein
MPRTPAASVKNLSMKSTRKKRVEISAAAASESNNKTSKDVDRWDSEAPDGRLLQTLIESGTIDGWNANKVIQSFSQIQKYNPASRTKKAVKTSRRHSKQARKWTTMRMKSSQFELPARIYYY